MTVKKFVKLIRDDEGSGLILALMTLMVLSVLGASLGAITIGSYKLGDVNRDDNSAYYIAEAGANLAYEEMERGVQQVYEESTEGTFFPGVKKVAEDVVKRINLNEYKAYSFESQFGERPKVTVDIEIPDNGESRNYKITSLGEIGNRTRTVEKNVTVSWIPKISDGIKSSLPQITTTVAKNKITLDNGVIISGAIHVDNETNKASVVIGNNVEMNAKIYINKNADINSSIEWKNEKQSTVEVIKRNDPLNWEVYDDLLASFPNLPIKNDNDEWGNVINTDGEIKTFVFDDLSLDTDLVINGGGRVNIFVKNSLDLGNADINWKMEADQADQLQIFYLGGNPVNINESNFDGTLFLNNSDLVIVKKPNLKGLIIVGGNELEKTNVDLGKGVNLNALIIAPYSYITLSNSDSKNSIQGIIVGDEVDLVNGLNLTFSDHYLKNFPLQLPNPDSDGSGDGSGGSGGGELIITEPGIEN